mmetsp:Transcript_9616/g.17481  ORF Transcript_9616/g.17481 Transcript_9616/m.17481 type:complete len:122 (-) Transcript_9616:166-531(-)
MMRITALCLLSLATTSQASLLRGSDRRTLDADDPSGCFNNIWGINCTQMAATEDLLRDDLCVDTKSPCACTGGDECFAVPDPPGGFLPYCALTAEEAALENNGISTIVIKLACSGENIDGP